MKILILFLLIFPIESFSSTVDFSDKRAICFSDNASRFGIETYNKENCYTSGDWDVDELKSLSKTSFLHTDYEGDCVLSSFTNSIRSYLDKSECDSFVEQYFTYLSSRIEDTQSNSLTRVSEPHIIVLFSIGIIFLLIIIRGTRYER